MPRVILSEADRNRYRDRDEDKMIRARIDAWCGYYQKSISDLAEAAGMNPRTLYRRKQKPGEMTLDEYRTIMRLTEHAAQAAAG